MNHVKCLIIGSGPAGYTAAIYAGRANLSPVVYVGQQMGGQLTQTTEIENFPGYPQGVDANQMMMELQQQAERFGADVRAGEVTEIDFTGRPYVVTVDGTDKLTADAINIATGAKAKCKRLCHVRRFLLPQEGDCRGRWRRHCLRGCAVSLRTVSEGLPRGAQGLPACFRHYAAASEVC